MRDPRYVLSFLVVGFVVALAVSPASGIGSGWFSVEHPRGSAEGNLATANGRLFVGMPDDGSSAGGDRIERSLDGGHTWTWTNPPENIGVWGLEGDVAAHGDHVMYFGTRVAGNVFAKSTNGGLSWSFSSIPAPPGQYDQPWLFLGPVKILPTQPAPYTLAAWTRVGTIAQFSWDGGVTWPRSAAIPGDAVGWGGNVVGTTLPGCEDVAHPPMDMGDVRIANPAFARQESGRHGAWGPDANFYWTYTKATAEGTTLFVCRTEDLGLSWTGIAHPIPEPPMEHLLTFAAFDERGTFYVLFADTMFVSFDNGESFRYAHKLPAWNNVVPPEYFWPDLPFQAFAVAAGSAWIGAIGTYGSECAGATGCVLFERALGLATPSPSFTVEPVVAHDGRRTDFLQLTVSASGVPTLSYALAREGSSSGSMVWTATRAAAP